MSMHSGSDISHQTNRAITIPFAVFIFTVLLIALAVVLCLVEFGQANALSYPILSSLGRISAFGCAT